MKTQLRGENFISLALAKEIVYNGETIQSN